jgi:hypothetical protein
MPRTISTEVESGSVGGNSTQSNPTIGLTSPSTSKVAPIDPVAPGMAGINYNLSLQQTAMKEMASIQTSLNYINVGLQLTDITRQKNEMSTAYLSEHPDGVGYTAHMTDGYKKIVENKIDNSPNREIGNTLQQYLTQSLPSVIENSSRTEYEKGKEHVTTTEEVTENVLLSQLVENPADAPQIQMQYAANLAALKGVLSPGEYAKKVTDSWDKYGNTLGQTMILANPDKALRFFQSGGLSGMVKGSTLLHLEKTAVAQHDTNQRRYLTELRIAKNEARRAKAWDRVGITASIANGSVTAADIMGKGFSPETEERLLSYAKQVEGITDHQNDRLDEMQEAVSKGEPTVGFSSEEANRYYDTMLTKRYVERKGKVTSEEKAMIVLDSKINQRINSLTRDLTIDLERGSPEEAMSAAVAVNLLTENNFSKAVDISPGHKVLADRVMSNGIYNNSDPKRVAEFLVSARAECLNPANKEVFQQREASFKRYVGNTSRWGQIKEDIRGKLEKNSPEGVALERMAHRYLREAYLEGATQPADAANTMNRLLRQKWGTTDLNPQLKGGWWPFGDKRQVMYEPPEKVYPEYAETHWIKNDYAEACQEIVSYISKEGAVRLSQPLIKKYSSDKEKLHQNLCTSQYPTIEVNINGKWEKRTLRLERSSVSREGYNIYYLYDENDLLSKKPLKVPGTSVNFIYKVQTPISKEK